MLLLKNKYNNRDCCKVDDVSLSLKFCECTTYAELLVNCWILQLFKTDRETRSYNLTTVQHLNLALVMESSPHGCDFHGNPGYIHSAYLGLK